MRGAFLRALPAAGLLALGPTPSHAERLVPPFDVYEALGAPASGAGSAAAFEPWRVAHREGQGSSTWVLLALPDGATGGQVPGFGRPRYLGRVRDGERLVLVAPEISARERLRAGRPLTIAPSNGTVLVTRENRDGFARRAHHAFRALEWTVPPPSPRTPGPAPGLLPAFGRARTVRGAADVDSVIARVSADSLETHVRTLSEGSGWRTQGIPQQRYYANSATEVVHKPYIEVALRDALGDGNVSNHSFVYEDPDDVPRTYHNVVGRLPSGVPGAGAFLLTAHYDAIGSRTDPQVICQEGLRSPSSDCDCSAPPSVIDANPACDWEWSTDPSPGADDNASGVAVLLEAARVLSGLSFDFDVYFVAFQVEELGLIGSAAFADSVAAQGQDIFGVLNMDMLGYNAARNELDVVANESSEWLADFLVETATEFLPSLPVEKHIEFFGRSDHASFWSAGVDAVVLLEDLELPYPGYHTVHDLWDTTFPPSGRPDATTQFLLAARLAVGTLARFSVHRDAPDLAIPAGEIEARPGSGLRLEAGGTVVFSARVHNYGRSRLSFQGQDTDSLTVRVRFHDGDPSTGAPVIAETVRKDFFPAGGIVTLSATWSPGADAAGFHDIHAVLEGLDPGYDEQEASAANNSRSLRVFLQDPPGARPRLLTHRPFPNPVRGSRAGFQLYFELTRSSPGVTIEVFDLAGDVVARFEATDRFVTDGNQAGVNRLGSPDFRWFGPDLQSGVYLYSIRCFDESGALSDVGEGKVAFVR